MKQMIVLLALFVVIMGAGCSKHYVETHAEPGLLETHAEPRLFEAQSAKIAMIRYLKTHPDVFSSPGRTESADQLSRAPVSEAINGTVSIGWFTVDIERKSYRLIHKYGIPGSGWFEHWIWEGGFQRNSEGLWEVTDPKSLKERGE
ncbi:MAG: hypothetical protein GQ578_04380 [Desulfuromonadaceae bacterium]|nr:hypothetical protein [Desulfuromonadaceae bacterium]